MTIGRIILIMTKVRNCPFCQSDLVVVDFRNCIWDDCRYRFKCENCGAQGPVQTTSEEDAAAAWNGDFKEEHFVEEYDLTK